MGRTRVDTVMGEARVDNAMREARVDNAMREARVDILDAANGKVVDHCYGPTSVGSCPGANRDGIVPCNGRRIAASGAGPEHWLVFVPQATRHCPSAWNLAAVGY
jgi:hypothetical protein